jgi:hypothetical protein
MKMEPSMQKATTRVSSTSGGCQRKCKYISLSHWICVRFLIQLALLDELEREWKELRDEASQRWKAVNKSSTATTNQKESAYLDLQQKQAEFKRVSRETDACSTKRREQLNRFIERWQKRSKTVDEKEKKDSSKENNSTSTQRALVDVLLPNYSMIHLFLLDFE